MRLSFLFLLLILIPLFSLAQSSSPEVFGTGGRSDTHPNAQVSWTLGEAITLSLGSGAGQLTQGFQQTRLTVTALDEPEGSVFSLKVFPNPTSDELQIHLSEPVRARIRLSDMLGKVWLEEEVSQRREILLDPRNFSQGNYLLSVHPEGNPQPHHFKIQVIHSN